MGADKHRFGNKFGMLATVRTCRKIAGLKMFKAFPPPGEAQATHKVIAWHTICGAGRTSKKMKEDIDFEWFEEDRTGRRSHFQTGGFNPFSDRR
jgi:hypothetical protein